MKGNIKNYDEINRYDFYVKYYMQFAIGTKFEDCIEITKREYIDLRKKINNSKEAMIKVFATYTVGFFKSQETYVLQAVNKDVYYCLLKSQNYESNKRRHELERHLDRFFMQEDINKIASSDNVENIVLEEFDREEIKKRLNSILTKKQIERLYKNLILEISLVEIAKEEGTDAAAIYRCIERAIDRITKNLKNF